MEMSFTNEKELEGILHIENSFDGLRYLAARLAINISATLFGIKPSTLVRFSTRRGKNLVKLWDLYKEEILNGSNIEFIELKRECNNLLVLFYNRRNLSKQLFNGKHLRFLSRFEYSEAMSLDTMLEHLKDRYTDSCPHEIGLFLGIPLKDVLGYLNLVPLKCSYCGHWKVYGSYEKTLRLFESYRVARQKAIEMICLGEDPLEIITRPGAYPSVLAGLRHQSIAV